MPYICTLRVFTEHIARLCVCVCVCLWVWRLWVVCVVKTVRGGVKLRSPLGTPMMSSERHLSKVINCLWLAGWGLGRQGIGWADGSYGSAFSCWSTPYSSLNTHALSLSHTHTPSLTHTLLHLTHTLLHTHTHTVPYSLPYLLMEMYVYNHFEIVLEVIVISSNQTCITSELTLQCKISMFVSE